MKLKLKIINLDGVYLQREVDLLNIMTTSGNLTIYANHLPLITNICISHMYTKDHDVKVDYAIAGGTLFVNEEECEIVTPAIESMAEIDYNRAAEAKQRALNRIQTHDEDIDLKRAEVALKKAINRLELK